LVPIPNTSGKNAHFIRSPANAHRLLSMKKVPPPPLVSWS